MTSFESKRKKHSWLSPIVVACCKSHNPTRGQGVTPRIITYLLPRTKNFIVPGRGKGELVSTIFPQISSKGKPPKVTLWPSLFAQKPSWNKPNQVKKPYSPYCLDWTHWGLMLLWLLWLTHFGSHQICIGSEPSHPVGGDGSAHQPPW